MIYKFKSKAAGDVIMMGPNGDELLRLLGREPAAQGIFEVAHMPQYLQAIEAAVQAAEAPPDEEGPDGGTPRRVGLRQRLWPVHEMIKRAHAAGQPIVWGV
jgi:hypothetical protein